MTSFTPIAVVGIGGVFPCANTPTQYWDNLLNQIDACDSVPAARWSLSPDEAYHPDGRVDSVRSLRAGLIEGFEFNSTGYQLPAELLDGLDPVFHLALHVSRQAWLESVHAPIDRSRVGVILAAIALPTDTSSALTQSVYGTHLYRQLFPDSAAAPLPCPELGTSPYNSRPVGMPAGVVAGALGFGGGSYTLDAACASSLYAIKLACDRLHQGTAEAMLAGGVSRPDCLYTQMGFTQLQALSSSGVCRPFDQHADGLVVGEGAGCFVLKRLETAREHGDRIYAVIRGIGVSNDIEGNLLAPSSEGQLRAMRQAYQQAQWDPRSVGLIECHGTGTPLGDMVELESLHTLWRETENDTTRCALGSVKSNIGHLLTAAGIAGAIKTVLALHTQTLPPQINFQSPAPNSPLQKQSPFCVQTEAQPWHNTDQPRRAAVSAFGFGGINGHLLCEEWDAQTADTQPSAPITIQSDAEPIAVVGLALECGTAKSVTEFQHQVFQGHPLFRHRPETRWWTGQQTEHAWLATVAEQGAYLDTVQIPVGQFRIPPNEIPELLPQQLLMLSVAHAALVDAGMPTQHLGPRCGVLVGLGLDLETTNYHLRWSFERVLSEWATRHHRDQTTPSYMEWKQLARSLVQPGLNAPRTLGALGSVTASRIAKNFGCGGPSFTVSAEENSGVRALEIAVQLLRQGELDSVLVGAVDLCCDLRVLTATGHLRSFCAPENTRPFDPASQGSPPGEGACAVVLKRLDHAQQDGDRVYAVVRSIGVASQPASHETKLEVLPETYAMALQRAYHDSQTSPQTVEYLETNGSGIPATDGTEARALNDFFPATPTGRALGALSPITGWLGACTGLASCIKACLCLHHKVLAPLNGFQQPDPALAWDGFFMPHAPQHWVHNRADGLRHAGVSTIGLDGSCTHIVLQETPPTTHHEPTAAFSFPLGVPAHGLFVVTGDDRTALSEQLNELETLVMQSARSCYDLARLWWQRLPSPRHGALRLVFLCTDHEQLSSTINRIKTCLQQGQDPQPSAEHGVYYTDDPVGTDSQLAFVFPGSGNHFVGMGRLLEASFPEVMQPIYNENNRLADQLIPWYRIPRRTNWLDGWHEVARREFAADTRQLICAQVGFGVFVSDLLRRLSITPDMTIGYSLGETTSLFALRVWQDRDAMFAKTLSSSLFQTDLDGHCHAARVTWQLPPDEQVNWKMAVLSCPVQTVREALVDQPRVYLLIINTPDECVVGGQQPELEAFVARLQCEAVYLEGVSCVHCELVHAVEDQYRSLHQWRCTPPERTKIYSAVWGKPFVPDEQSAAQSILDQALYGFDYPALIRTAYQDGARVFVEIGPHHSCTRMISKILAGKPHLACSVSTRGEDELATLMRCLALLLSHHVAVDVAPLFGATTATTADDPPRPMLQVAVGSCLNALPACPLNPPPYTDEPVYPSTQTDVSAFSGQPPVQTALGDLLTDVASSTTQAHEMFLRFAHNATDTFAQGLSLQTKLLEALVARGVSVPAATIPDQLQPGSLTPPNQQPPVQPVAFSREECLEFAVGSIAKMLGPEFAPVDDHPTRVRLPDEPLMLVDRILSVTGVPISLTHGQVVTEHDVLPDAWYLDYGRAPVCITVEAGQADLFLSGYLGIDFKTKGLRVYRLLDATVQFHRGLPRAGETVRYTIDILKFVRQGETYLFFFQFDATINGELVLTMRDGCAGFFTEQEINSSGGVITKPDTPLNESAGKAVPEFAFVPMTTETYTDAQIAALRHGNLAECFGSAFVGVSLADPVRIPDGRMRLIDRVLAIEPHGGFYGLGRIKAEADVHPNDWYLTCHFVDDMVMPGTLMYQCCEHTLRVFLMRMGWVAESQHAAWEPLLGVSAKLCCRGPVTAATRKVVYQIDIKELGFEPHPYAVADALMYADGRAIVKFENMSLQLTGVTRTELERLWAGHTTTTPSTQPLLNNDLAELPVASRYPYETILAFAIGKPSHAFGDRYQVFDHDRRIARLPGPPYLFLDAITQVVGKPWELTVGSAAEARYEVPQDAWYFRANRQQSMPFAVLLEIPLQVCGWLAAYMGSALSSPHPLSFRNLGGTATLYREFFEDAGTLVAQARTTNISQAGGMIIQEFEFQVWQQSALAYEGTTMFGFFTESALAQQVGLRNTTTPTRYTPTAADISLARPITLESLPPLTPEDLTEHPAAPGALPAQSLLMIDSVELLTLTEGPHGHGVVIGSKMVDPEEWFFKAHFFQDPVMPGSLGLEALIQLLKIYAQQRWSQLTNTHRFTPIRLAEPHTWVYRGQVIPSNHRVEVQALITAVTDTPVPTVVAEGILFVDQLPIYAMQSFGLQLLPIE